MKQHINHKIRVLKHFGILDARDTTTITAVKKVLGTCQNETQVDIVLYNVLHGNETLNDLLHRKGAIQ